MGQTRVDLQHLLEDIRDAYPGSLEESIVTEIVANSLDSGASWLRFETDSERARLTVVDDGSGMARRELARYHDIAASAKSRGQGIGFAGVGIKLGILASDEVFTETRRGAGHVATSWRLASRHKAPWRWVPPAGLVGQRGTAVRLALKNPLSPLLESGFLEATLLRHFQPLFESVFSELLSSHYPTGVRFLVNGRPLQAPRVAGERAPISVRLARKRRPSAQGYLVRHAEPSPEDDHGLAVSTLGKVIKRGWDWLGFAPRDAPHVSGLIEVPGLAASLTLSKADFIRSGARGALYLAYRKAIQEVVSAQLSRWGDGRAELEEEARRRKARPVERDLAAVLVDLAEDFPLIASLVAQRPGGQRRLPMGPTRGDGLTPGLALAEVEAAREVAEAGAGGEPRVAPAPDVRDEPEAPAPEGSEDAASATLPAGRGRRRPARLGLSLRFESRPEDPNLGRLVESTVWVNDGHAAYRRAAASRAEGYHLALTVALALAPLAVEPAQGQAFVNAFLARWGEAVERPRRRGRPRRPTA
jgi:hypothetical protein